MSFDSGPGGYAPPAPKKALSPWAWVGIGCGTLTVLGLGGCIAVSVMFKNAMEKTASPEEVMAELKSAEVPIYPGATFDEKATKAAGAASGVMGMFSGGKIKMHMGAFSVADPAPKVQQFYQDKLGPIGYSPMNQEFKNPAGRNMEQRQYKKDDVMVMVQTQNPTKPGQTGCILILSKVTGLGKDKLK